MRWLRMAWLPVVPVVLVLAGASGAARPGHGPGLDRQAGPSSRLRSRPRRSRSRGCAAVRWQGPPARHVRRSRSSALSYPALGAGHGGEQCHAGKMARRGRTARGGWLPGLPPAQNLGRVALALGQLPPRALFAAITRCMYCRTSCTDPAHPTLPNRNRTGNHEPLSSPRLGGRALAGEEHGPSPSLTRTRAAAVRPQIIQQGQFPEDSRSS